MAPMDKHGGIPIWGSIGASPVPSAKENVAPVTIVGGGPVGLTFVLDLGRRGRRVVLLNQLSFIAAGSKAICFAKRSLDIWDRLGVGESIAKTGVAWNVGKVFWGDRPAPIYQLDLAPAQGQKMPTFVNLQQYQVEEALVRALEKLANVDLRWGVRQSPSGKGPNTWASTSAQTTQATGFTPAGSWRATARAHLFVR